MTKVLLYTCLDIVNLKEFRGQLLEKKASKSEENLIKETKKIYVLSAVNAGNRKQNPSININSSNVSGVRGEPTVEPANPAIYTHNRLDSRHVLNARKRLPANIIDTNRDNNCLGQAETSGRGDESNSAPTSMSMFL